MKQVIFSIALLLTTVGATAQTHVSYSPASAKYEAANWKLKLVDNPGQIVTVPPPTVAQSQTELKTVKQRMSDLDKNKIEQINYWNAGAPCFHIAWKLHTGINT